MPKLSIVIAAFNNVSLLEQCLTSLKGQWEEPDTEVFVAANYSEGVEQMIKNNFPSVLYRCFSKKTTVPELRTEGILQTTGEIVALAEDHGTFDNRWCAQIKKAHESSYSIIGGSIENVSKGLLGWAVYFHDYGKYMLPSRAGVVKTLSEFNISYKRALLNEIKDDFQNGFFGALLDLKLAKEGNSLYLMPTAIVYHNKSYTFKKAFIQCYHYGRSFAVMRVANTSLFLRLGLALGSILLPVILSLRILLNTLRKKRLVKELILSFPYLVLLMISWSYGELCGYLIGEGESTAKWV